MELLFSPCTRLHDLLLENLEDADLEYELSENTNDLMMVVCTEELLSAESAFTYADLYSMLGNEDTVVWLTPHAAVVPANSESMAYCFGELDESCRYCFKADCKKIDAVARSPEHLLEICYVVSRLLAASDVHSVVLERWSSIDGAFIDAPTLAYLYDGALPESQGFIIE
jgi:hypothetical protein